MADPPRPFIPAPPPPPPAALAGPASSPSSPPPASIAARRAPPVPPSALASASASLSSVADDVKETREASVRAATLNGQYVLGHELGRGSFGTVHVADDLVRGFKVAIKAMDAKKLRRTKAALAMRPGGSGGPRGPFQGVGAAAARRQRLNSNVSGPSASEMQSRNQLPSNNAPSASQSTPDPIDLVRGEIAIMKKLQHPNIVRLFEVLHDPSEEIIYMVYELVEKGTVIDVSMSKSTDPLSENVARRYFRQLILGIEYLHEHDIAHRDIKPDNLLISKDDVLKIVDFGVSEIFSSQGNDKSKKTEGSPAFFPPELCMPNHGEISARAVDVWAIGVTLFCMVRGTLPFKGDSIVDLYDQIKCSTPPIELMSSNLADLIGRLLDKSPDTRITMDEIRDHPWITNNSADPLIPTKAQNCHKMVTEITKEEIATAVSVFNPVWTVMRAIQKFKTKLTPSSSPAASRENLSILAAAPSGSDVVKSSDSLQVPDRIV